MNVVYLDNNATTMVAPEVVQAMLPYFSQMYGNASSMHTFGGQVGRAISTAREQVAALLGARPDEIIFTSCGTESDATAILSALRTQPDKRHVITTRVEHSAILSLGQHLESRGYEVTYLGVDARGRLDPDELAAAMRKDTAIVSLMFANNETGTIFPIERLAEMVKERGILFHTDAVQAAGKLPIDLAKLPIDFLSISGHKLHAPKGIGALYARKGTRFQPFLRGGHQEGGRRAGTENAPYIVGLGKACELALAGMEAEQTRVPALRDRLERELLAAVPDADYARHMNLLRREFAGDALFNKNMSANLRTLDAHRALARTGKLHPLGVDALLREILPPTLREHAIQANTSARTGGQPAP